MAFTYGAYTACLQDRPLEEVLDILKANGLTGAEVNAGGFIPSPHAHVDLLLGNAAARTAYLDVFARRGMRLSGLNASGNPLSPLPGVGPKHTEDVYKTIELASRLGVEEIVTMSGCPGSDPDARYPSWVVNPWNGVDMDILDYQWSLLVPFWQQVDRFAAGRSHRARSCQGHANLPRGQLSGCVGHVVHAGARVGGGQGSHGHRLLVQCLARGSRLAVRRRRRGP